MTDKQFQSPRAGAHAPEKKKRFVLIACEESQVEVSAWRAAGFISYSCDIQICSGGHPEWHIVGDCRELFTPGVHVFRTQDYTKRRVPRWDMIIAHPPCTYLSKAGAKFLFPGGTVSEERLAKGMEAKRFFLECLGASAPFIAVENPVPMKIYELPLPSCYVEPWWYGDNYSKKTLFWLKNLPPLMPYFDSIGQYKSWVHCTRGGKKRSLSFPGVAQAMVEQWGSYVNFYDPEWNIP